MTDPLDAKLDEILLKIAEIMTKVDAARTSTLQAKEFMRGFIQGVNERIDTLTRRVENLERGMNR